MKRFAVLLASAALVSAGAAYADCQEELSALQGGVSKTGTTAPLAPGQATPQTGPSDMGAQGKTEQHGDMKGVTKDGTNEPLGANPEIATSAQDAQAQQQGGETAAQQAMTGGEASMNDTRADAIARAQEALKNGNEEACMKAVEEAKAM